MSQSTKPMPGDIMRVKAPFPDKIMIDGPGTIGHPPLESASEAVKFDEDKVRMELLPPEFLTSTASILTFGAKKYADRNWEQGMDWSRVYGALQRHLNAWWSGEHTDPETGKSHLWHANCCMAFLTTYEMRGVGTDDRPYPKEGEGI